MLVDFLLNFFQVIAQTFPADAMRVSGTVVASWTLVSPNIQTWFCSRKNRSTKIECLQLSVLVCVCICAKLHICRCVEDFLTRRASHFNQAFYAVNFLFCRSSIFFLEWKRSHSQEISDKHLCTFMHANTKTLISVKIFRQNMHGV